ncbi:hypothetical protein [Opitutus terrae]|uniref:Uncharacterized protein n=1 Tax=Opitutus terrae (strain DSM 11246 / JCM 15787 / PB90-1) TaxID=452637 RepID=B1ZSI2_OPITP|nr:hypothetical protein [Opitutus terrae]ACB73839.1 conserved hypothetical protein [Opitutus terrae PB90-1]
MKEQRNPFLLRTAEYIDTDPAFVRFFGPGTLELLKENQALVTRVFQSAPGGGKTSLMRLFTPGPLLELHKNKDVDGYDDLFEKMRGFGVISDDGPHLLGIPLTITRSYGSLADIGLDSTQQIRLFYALLDARIILAALRYALTLRRIRSDSELPRFTLEKPNVPVELPGLTLPCTGDVLYQWAKDREDEICATLDSFSPRQITAGSDGLLTLDLFKPGAFRLDGKPVAEHVLIMLDDAQYLTALQHERLLTFVLEKRSTTPVWIAERLQVLTNNELLSLGAVGAIEGRDYERVYLESYWRSYPKRFETVVNSIADRRARGSRTVEVYHFDKCLEDTLDGTEWEERHAEVLATITARVKARAAQSPLFDAWIAEREALNGSTRAKALAWRELEILVERELRKNQRSLGIPLETEVLADKSDNSLTAAAELFLANEFDLPYYFGSATLAKLSSSNIQQYLGLAAQQFEVIISAVLISPSQPPLLPAARQQQLVVKASNEMWEEIPRRATQGARVRNLLAAIGAFSRWYTQRPTAPNDPGVNAIAISMADRERLMDRTWTQHRPDHAMLAEVLASALTLNYLDAQPNYRCKGQDWLILNLNRLLCVKYQLPLNYGKFKEQKLDELVRWMERGFEARRESMEEELL